MPGAFARAGQRHSVGVFVPDFNSTVEPELADLRPHGVSHQTARFALGPDVIERIGEAAERLAPSGVRAWIIGLSTEPFPGGLELLDQGIEALRKRTGLPVFTPPHATRAGLEALGAKRIGIVTPFDDAANEAVRAVYERWDFEVASIVGLDRPGYDEIATTPDDETRRAFSRLPLARVDALVQVGTGLPMLHHIDALERELDRPIVAANPAVYWQALRAAEIGDSIPGAGRLFSARLREGDAP